MPAALPRLLTLLLLAAGCVGGNPAYRQLVDGPTEAGVETAGGGKGGAAQPSPQPIVGSDASTADRASSSSGGSWGSVGGAGGNVDAAPALEVASAPIPGFVGYWPFEDTSGTRVRDHSGHGRDGNFLSANAGLAWDQGKTGGGLRIPGGRSADAAVQVLADDVIDGLKIFTVSAHFKIRALSVAGTHLSVVSRQLLESNNELFNITCNATSLIAYIPAEVTGEGSQTTYEARDREALMNKAGQWVHAAMTYDGMELALFVDGMERARWPFRGRWRSSPGTPILLGANRNQSHSEPFDGVIDDIAIYDHVVSSETIQKLSTGMSPLQIR